MWACWAGRIARATRPAQQAHTTTAHQYNLYVYVVLLCELAGRDGSCTRDNVYLSRFSKIRASARILCIPMKTNAKPQKKLRGQSQQLQVGGHLEVFAVIELMRTAVMCRIIFITFMVNAHM